MALANRWKQLFDETGKAATVLPNQAGPQRPVAMEPVRPVVLEGLHVRLEPLAERHLRDLLPIVQGPRETFAITWVPRDEEGLHRYLATALEEQRLGQSLPFATVDRQSGAAVGSTRFMTLDVWPAVPGSPLARPAGVPHGVEIGHTWLSPGAQRTALNTEAKLLMLGHAFERWEVLRVTLKTDARNLRSRTAIERLGARFDGILRAAMLAADGGPRDTAYYSILAAEWPEVRGRLEARLARGAPGVAT
jgi:RimJ/RimL family protein N-acetyltransferase